MELGAALLAVPDEAVELVGVTLAFDHQTHRPRRTTRRMGHARGKQENLSRTDRDVTVFALVVDDLQGHVTFELIEKFLALVDVIVLSRVRAANDHDDEVTIFPNHLISDRRFEQMPVFIDPAFEIERSQLVSFRHTFFGSVKNLNASRPAFAADTRILHRLRKACADHAASSS